MDDFSLQNALKELLDQSQWKGRFLAIHIKACWEEIAGKTVARYTEELRLEDKTLYIHTPISALKQELRSQEQNLIEKLNLHFQANVVQKIIIT